MTTSIHKVAWFLEPGQNTTLSYGTPAWQFPKEMIRSHVNRIREDFATYARAKLALAQNQKGEGIVIRAISPSFDLGLTPSEGWGLPAIPAPGEWVPFVQHYVSAIKAVCIYGVTTDCPSPSLAEMRIGFGHPRGHTISHLSLGGCFDLAPILSKLRAEPPVEEKSQDGLYGPAVFFSEASLFAPLDFLWVDVMVTRGLSLGEERYPLLGFVAEPQ